MRRGWQRRQREGPPPGKRFPKSLHGLHPLVCCPGVAFDTVRALRREGYGEGDEFAVLSRNLPIFPADNIVQIQPCVKLCGRQLGHLLEEFHIVDIHYNVTYSNLSDRSKQKAVGRKKRIDLRPVFNPFHFLLAYCLLQIQSVTSTVPTMPTIAASTKASLCVATKASIYGDWRLGMPQPVVRRPLLCASMEAARPAVHSSTTSLQVQPLHRPIELSYGSGPGRKAGIGVRRIGKPEDHIVEFLANALPVNHLAGKRLFDNRIHLYRAFALRVGPKVCKVLSRAKRRHRQFGQEDRKARARTESFRRQHKRVRFFCRKTVTFAVASGKQFAIGSAAGCYRRSRHRQDRSGRYVRAGHSFRPEHSGSRGQCLEQYGTGELTCQFSKLSRGWREQGQVVDVLRAHAPMWLLQMPSLVSASDRELLSREVFGATRERMLRRDGRGFGGADGRPAARAHIGRPSLERLLDAGPDLVPGEGSVRPHS